ncbi:glycosyltransferase [Ancylobacter sp. G4_0304]|uniref:glycosyltransferase n=1 Tax=Ancylobacter sp. G4_0304 TaxID=3114289 RepID=UPI0039C5E009
MGDVSQKSGGSSGRRKRGIRDYLSGKLKSLLGKKRRDSLKTMRGTDISLVIRLVYNHFLQRDPDRRGYAHYRDQLLRGMPLSKFIGEVAASAEDGRRLADADEITSGTDGEFILDLGEALFRNGAAKPRDIEFYKHVLREQNGSREALVRQFVNEYLGRLRHPDPGSGIEQVWIMGTDRFLTRQMWDERVAALGIMPAAPEVVPLEQRHFTHSGHYRVSAIASLYRGRQFIESFLENIVHQTLFAESELIIIDADSPEGEAEIIERYQRVYPNIVYRRINYRIGIYDAWNVGIGLARGAYITNVNLDDLRRQDSFELQAATLDAHPETDVAYQDFFYSMDSAFGFDEVARCDFRSDLPLVTRNNMLEFNSPHNAPMWRKRLHDEIGLFDTQYRSAGDYEFWLRCLAYDKSFYKINTPHVVYFQNPTGLSTSAESRGYEEGRRIWRHYARRLISPYLTMSRAAFESRIGWTGPRDWGASSYDLVHERLRVLGDEAKRGGGEGAASGRLGAGA